MARSGQAIFCNDFASMPEVMESDDLNEFYYYQEPDGKWGLKLL